MENEYLKKFIDELDNRPQIEIEQFNSFIKAHNSVYLQGYNDAINRVCEWLNNNGCFSYLQEDSQSIEDVEKMFRKVMKDKI